MTNPDLRESSTVTCDGCGRPIEADGYCGCPLGDDRLMNHLTEERDRYREALHQVALATDGNWTDTAGMALGRAHKIARDALEGSCDPQSQVEKP